MSTVVDVKDSIELRAAGFRARNNALLSKHNQAVFPAKRDAVFHGVGVVEPPLSPTVAPDAAIKI